MTKKIKTIFEVMGQKADEETCIEFDEGINHIGEWQTTDLSSNDYDNVIFTGKDKKYEYYVAWDDKADLEEISIYRKKKGDC